MVTHWTGAIDHSLLDRAMPRPHYVVTEQLVLPVPSDEAYDAVTTFALTDVRQPAVRMGLWLGRLPNLILGRKPSGRPAQVTLDDLATDTNWLLLGRRPGREVVLGAVGRFWSPFVRWKRVAQDEFATFNSPSWAKIVIGFSVLPYGDQRSVVAHEARIFFYDRGTEKTFTMFWWWMIRPLVRVALRAMLRDIRDTAIVAARAVARAGGRDATGRLVDVVARRDLLRGVSAHR
jgi:hypothetical protein